MAIRPGRAYTNMNGRPYTRVSKVKPRKSYVKGVPLSKIFHFELGDTKNKGKYPAVFCITSTKRMNFRSNCLESARITIGEYFKKKSINNFFAKILVYPHHVLRENPLATGAGADRFSQGMRRAFGKPIGSAARISAGQKIIEVRVANGQEDHAKEALRRAARKLPGACKIVKT